jgi:glycosyltransferase involved in cell wall biosynthesis
MKILFLVPYPLKESPSQRFRFEQYFEILIKTNHTFHVQSFLSLTGWRTLYQPGHFFIKAWTILSGFIRRLFILIKLSSFDYVFIHREAAPVGPPVIEWLIAKVFQKKIIYDFDDAIWLTDKLKENALEKIVRWRSKVGSISQWSYKVSCGNEYLCLYAQQFNMNVVLNPTTIDTVGLHHPNGEKKLTDHIIIGWTGSHSTLKYLKDIEPVLSFLEKKYPQLKILVIADRMPELALHSLIFLPWNKETEASDLTKADIGIMPLPDDEWAKGKCGFKALQYLALEIPTVISPVGVNTKIVTQSDTGFLCSTPSEWTIALEKLITDSSLRTVMGKKGRQKVIEHFSVESNKNNFLNLFS